MVQLVLEMSAVLELELHQEMHVFIGQLEPGGKVVLTPSEIAITPDCPRALDGSPVAVPVVDVGIETPATFMQN